MPRTVLCVNCGHGASWHRDTKAGKGACFWPAVSSPNCPHKCKKFVRPDTAPPKPTGKALGWWDEWAGSIKRAKAHNNALLQLVQEQDKLMHGLERELRFIRLQDRDPDVAELDYHIQRFDRLCELRNMMELAGFCISLREKLNRAWKRLP